MKTLARVLGILLLAAATLTVTGCSAEEFGEDADQLGEEVDLDDE